VEQVVAVRYGLAPAVAVERKSRPRRLAVFGGDDDDAVRPARAVDRRRGRVLQDLDRLDVARVERGERIRRNLRRRLSGITPAVARILRVRIVLDGEAVDDIQRLIVARGRRSRGGGNAA